MSQPFRLLAGAVLVSIVLSGCSGSPSALDPHGPKGDQVTTLWWILFVVAAIVTVIVLLLGVWAAFGPRTGEAPARGFMSGHAFVLTAGALIPAVILIGVFAYTLRTTVTLSAPSTLAKMTIKVVGHRWWWEFDYLNQHFVTANEMHVPAGQPVRLELTSADVIHSFWVPQLGPQIDTVPGIVNTTWTEASRAQTYRGECNVFCGIQHANMDFLVVADPPARFAAWLRDQESVPPQPAIATLYQGQQVFQGATCVYCHTIRGANASGTVGPDLTHFGSRQSIGADIVPNTPAHLGAWIANSQTFKPGNLMPAMNLPSKQLHEVVTYLESLK